MHSDDRLSLPWSIATPPSTFLPRVSIIIVVHNAANWTRHCLFSVLQWTSIAYEIIVVDNGSTDDTAQFLTNLGESVDLRILSLEDNIGYAGANNRGADLARGEFLLFLNSDVVVTPNWLNNLVRVLDARSDAVAVGPRSNHAMGDQGCIYLPNADVDAVNRFARHFNWHDPYRWKETSALSGYALMVRKAAFVVMEGFDERFPIGTGEDRELSSRLRQNSHVLICAGDTFVFHAGHASFLAAKHNFAHQENLNRRLLRADRSDLATDQDPIPRNSVVCLNSGARYLIREDGRGTVAHPVAIGRLTEALGYPAAAGDFPDSALSTMEIGEPIFFVRGSGPDVYIYAFGQRHRLLGRWFKLATALRGITVLFDDVLASIPEGEAINVDHLIEIRRPRQKPGFDDQTYESRFLGTEEVMKHIDEAIEFQRPLSLVRIGSGEAITINNDAIAIAGFDTDYSGVDIDDEEAACLLIEAVRDADIVGLSPDWRVDYCAALIQQLFEMHTIHPRMTCSAYINWDVLGVDRDTGEPVRRSRTLFELLHGRRVALVGRLASTAYALGMRTGLNVKTAVNLEGFASVDSCLDDLRAARRQFDVVLVAGGVPGVVVCTRAALDLGCPVIDFGHCLNYLVNPLFNEATLINEKLRWRLSRYVAQHPREPNDEGQASPYDGAFVRTEKGRIYYIESGYKRHVPNRVILDAFDAQPVDVTSSELAPLPVGLPFFLVVDEVGGAFLIKDGLRWGIDVAGLPTIGVDTQVLASLDCASTRLRLTLSVPPRPSRTDSL